MALEIVIASARCLPRINPTPNMKLYVVVSITDIAVNKQIRAQTDVDQHSGGNPTWNFSMKFDVEGLKQDVKAGIVFALKCKDHEKGNNKDLGEVHVLISELLKSVKDENYFTGSYVVVSHPVREPSGETVALLNFHYKFGGSPMSNTPTNGSTTSRSMGVYPPPQGDNYPVYPPPPPATGNGGYQPLSAAGYGGYPPPPPPPSHSSYPYPTYNVGPSAAPPSPSHYTPQPAYPPPYNVGSLAAPPSHYMPSSPYPPYNVGISAAPPYAYPYPPHPSHVQARAAPVEQQSVQKKKKKSVWGSALGSLAGAVAVGVLSSVAEPSYEIPRAPELSYEIPPAPELSYEILPAPAPEFFELMGGLQIPDPRAYL